jgi:nitroimidazol reductase NimA-like FMN-containing flavoprotein (pyridoxamine 5'-phosphate oxidase superfamily)
MPGYGLPKSKKGLLSWKWAEKKLASSREYWIITVRPDGRPHAMPVWGLWWNNVFYFSTGSNTRKTKNLDKNSHCVVATEDAADAVILEGRAERVKDPSLIREFFPMYGRKYKWDMSGMKDDMISLKEPLFAVYPKVAFGQIEKTFAKTATRWNFSQGKKKA